MKIMILILALLITSCVAKPTSVTTPITAEKDSCISDSDCMVAGCSGQLCGSKKDLQGIITTCEWKEQYACYKLTSCSCIDKKCQWQQTNEFLTCINKYKSD